MKIFSRIASALALLLIAPVAMAAANISIESLVSAVIYLVIVGLIFWLIWWFVGYVGLPAPFDKVVRVIIGLVALIFLINLLLGLAGHPLFTFG